MLIVTLRKKMWGHSKRNDFKRTDKPSIKTTGYKTDSNQEPAGYEPKICRMKVALCSGTSNDGAHIHTVGQMSQI